MQGQQIWLKRRSPDCASLHPGYDRDTPVTLFSSYCLAIEVFQKPQRKAAQTTDAAPLKFRSSACRLIPM